VVARVARAPAFGVPYAPAARKKIMGIHVQRSRATEKNRRLRAALTSSLQTDATSSPAVVSITAPTL
jgi:hypothetical protein